MADPVPACCAIFDHDGVLVDSFDFHQRAWLELGKRTGLPFTEQFVHATFGMTNPSIFSALPGGPVDPAEIQQLGDLKEQCYRELAADHLTLMPGVRALIDRLSSAGVQLAIGSSGPRANLELTVDRCGLAGRFATVVALEDITYGKPNPEVFLHASKRTGALPAHCIVFEDAMVGIQAAKAAGMLAIGVGTTNPLDRLTDAGADHVVATLEEFPITEWLGRLRHAPG